MQLLFAALGTVREEGQVATIGRPARVGIFDQPGGQLACRPMSAGICEPDGSAAVLVLLGDRRDTGCQPAAIRTEAWVAGHWHIGEQLRRELGGHDAFSRPINSTGQSNIMRGASV